MKLIHWLFSLRVPAGSREVWRSPWEERTSGVYKNLQPLARLAEDLDQTSSHLCMLSDWTPNSSEGLPLYFYIHSSTSTEERTFTARQHTTHTWSWNPSWTYVIPKRLNSPFSLLHLITPLDGEKPPIIRADSNVSSSLCWVLNQSECKCWHDEGETKQNIRAINHV